MVFLIHTATSVSPCAFWSQQNALVQKFPSCDFYALGLYFKSYFRHTPGQSGKRNYKKSHPASNPVRIRTLYIANLNLENFSCRSLAGVSFLLSENCRQRFIKVINVGDSKIPCFKCDGFCAPGGLSSVIPLSLWAVGDTGSSKVKGDNFGQKWTFKLH